MNARSIVLRYLRRHGHAGLCLVDEPFNRCGCGIDDNFAHCGEGPYPECQPAHRFIIPESGVLIDPATGKAVEHDGLPGDSVYVPIFQHRRAA
jgi:hypothetical protein